MKLQRSPLDTCYGNADNRSSSTKYDENLSLIDWVQALSPRHHLKCLLWKESGNGGPKHAVGPMHKSCTKASQAAQAETNADRLLFPWKQGWTVQFGAHQVAKGNKDTTIKPQRDAGSRSLIHAPCWAEMSWKTMKMLWPLRACTCNLYNSY